MDSLNKLLNQKIEMESESRYKLEETCPTCGKKQYRKINIMDKDRVVRINCECESKAYEAKQAIEASKEKQGRLEKLLTNSLMDKKFRESTFEKWDFNKGSKQLYELGKRYANNFKDCKKEGLGLLIYGDPGNGKTYLSSCIANALLDQFITTICVSIDGLLGRIQQTYSKWGKEAEADIIRGLCNADLLIIDDLGTEKSSDWSRATIYNIIDSRNRSELPLIITTNLKVNPKEINGILTTLYDRRTESRILEMTTPVLNTGKDIRVEVAKKKTELLKKILY